MQLVITFEELRDQPPDFDVDNPFKYRPQRRSVANRVLQAIDHLLFATPLFLYQHVSRLGEPGTIRPLFSASRVPEYLQWEFERFSAIQSSLKQSDAYVLKFFDSRLPRIHQLDVYRAINQSLLHGIITGRVPLNEIHGFELSHISETMKRQLISLSSWSPPSRHKFPPTLAFMHHSVQIVQIQERSPLEIILLTLGPLGAIFGLIITGLWIGNYHKHSQIDLENKKIALKASEYILAKLQADEIEVTPELVAALVKHAEKSPIGLPSIANIRLDVKP